MVPLEDIEKILSDIRLAIDEGKFQPIERGKNKYTLSMLGISWDDVKSEIYELTATEYFQGPEVDRDDPHSDRFWMFKKSIDGQVIYIKFKVLYMKDGRVKVVSFHLDQP